MKLLKLTASSLLLFSFLLSLSSCEKDEEKDKVNLYSKSDIIMTGAQIAPVMSPSTGTGNLSVTYDKRTKLLNYTITWTNLSDSVIAIRLNGPAPVGYSALNTAFTGANPTAFATTPYLVLQAFTGTGTKAMYPANGSYTGSIAMDGVKIRETDLLNGLYYFTIHTKTMLPVAAPGSFLYRWFGEVRAQVKFQ